MNFLFSLNLKFRNRIRAVRRTAGRRPPIRSFIIFRSEDRRLHPPFHTFSLPFSLPSISLPTLSPALLDASLFFARRFFSANFPPRSFNPFQSATWIDLSLSLSVEFHSIRYFSFFVLSQCFLFLHLEFQPPPFHPSNFSFQLWTRVAYVSSLRDYLLTLSVPFVFLTLDRNYYKSPQLRGG